jgi:ribonucleoside-diphosphate reductase alpha chain
MGLGLTGVANALEALGYPYGSKEFCSDLDGLLGVFTNEVYKQSALLAKEKGPFPLYNQNDYLNGSHFINKLHPTVKDLISKHGIRNSHLTSIAPTGTISLMADNVSSGIEPVFSYSFNRTIQTPEGPRVEEVSDYGYREFGVKGKTVNDCTVEDHLKVLLISSKYIDSSVSKTCNVSDSVPFDDFKEIYMKAWEGGAKGCTTFRAAGKRAGILVTAPEEGEGSACYIDPETGKKTCE